MIARTLALAVGLFCGVVTSQLPEFGQQYRQRLGGAIDELRKVMQQFDNDAEAAGFSRGEALQHMVASNDPFLERRAASIGSTARRLDKLEQQQVAIDRASQFGRLLVLVDRSDPQILTNTYYAFEPAVPVTAEGFVAAGVGFAGGWSTVRLLGFLVRRRRRSRSLAHGA
ncbi:DUF2937 family protein [Rhodoligotrophos defluvii]|uniref:DUF2937 family protein n=1 Tax=Rhodoligotrophos defluvii TaxID=2561934 RepID=UPI0010C9B223|nr:DUF2937 family protein [Rhodoligotrophos defluvii]